MVANRISLTPMTLNWPASPWKLLEAFQGEVQNLFSHANTDSAVRMWTGTDTVAIEIDAPGLTEEAFEILPNGQKLVVRFKHSDSGQTGERVFLQERELRPTRYDLSLPFPVDAGQLDAVYQKGILRITARAPEQSQAKVVVRAG